VVTCTGEEALKLVEDSNSMADRIVDMVRIDIFLHVMAFV
jgi:hypothetical protein